MPTYYGKNGKLRIYDSTRGRDLSQSAPKQVHISKYSGGHSDITADMLNPATGTQTVLGAAADYIYVGNLFKFSRIAFDIATPASADGGALVAEYWNGASWISLAVNSNLTYNLVDGTASAGNTMRVDGAVSWIVPDDWAKNDPPTTGTSLYYVRVRTTTSTGTDAVVQLIEPASGQYYEVVFEQMNLVGPEGNNRPDEIIRLNRGRLDAAAHYIQGLDDPIVTPMQLTFSAWMDSVYNSSGLAEVLRCGEPGGLPETWPTSGISTKTDSQLPDGLWGNMVNTPQFTDPTKKTVCVQAMWDDLNGDRVYREYNEVYFPSSSVTLNEAPDSVTLNIQGAIYGSIRADLDNFGYRL